MNGAVSSSAAGGSSQKPQLLRRGSAMSGAPSWSGSIQLAKPVAAGISAAKIMTSACTPINWLKNSGCMSCRPGWNNSARTARIIEPPTRNMMSENVRYIVPMSLWLVVVNQRMIPVGWWSS